MAFVHLHNHTEYSLLDGFTHIKDMVRKAAEFDMPAIAITDHGVMSGVPELCSACEAVKAETGKTVKPLYGCEVYMVAEDEIRREKSQRRYHLLLIAKTNEGYHNLLKLVSESHVDNFYVKPLTTFSMLQKYGKGIICASACVAGIVPRLLDQGNYPEALNWAKKLASCFEPGDFYIELQNQGIVTNNGMKQNDLNHLLDRVAKDGGFKTIATNDFHYLNQEDAQAQDIILCIGMGKTLNDPNRMRFGNDQFYMKSEEEMRMALVDFPEACDNTVEIAEKCNVELERDAILPRFPLPEGETEESYFRKRCEEGLVRRYGSPVPPEVRERYEYEAGVIIQQGFPAYFLIVQEYIDWAKQHGIGVGPGRGSAAGAIVSYALGITDLDPLEHGLLFERFLSPERVEMPDIDVDFEQDRRAEVFEHVKELYGEDKVSSVVTYGVIKAKNAVRDAARVLDYPYALGDRITKMIPTDPKITIDEAFEQNPDLKKAYDQEEDVRAVVDAARSIEGHVRGEGVHACATIICRDPMSDHVPMKRDTKGGDIITQYDGHVTPDLGLLKMDFLGLRTLDVLSRACQNVENRCGVKIVPDQIPLDDPESFKLMQSGNMDGLFQVEGGLYVSLFKRLPPKRFSDIVASIALNRPGPLESGMVDDYVKIASGQTAIHYYDDRLKPILEETYGTMVYQEQIMQISMTMSGFSAGKADKLRKAMGKKKIDVMRELREDWNKGAIDNGYEAGIAHQIWDDAEKFAKYAFNKSHSAAYAILVMRTAYLKAHYPHEFMAAVLSSYMGNTDKLVHYIASCKKSGIAVLPPDINSSNLEFRPVDEGIRFGLVGVRGVGLNVAKEIIAERDENGPFSSLHDFVNRMDSHCFNRKTLEALIKAGAFDSTGYTRKQLMFFLNETNLLEGASKRQKQRDSGQISMFDLFAEEEEDGFSEEVPPPDGVEWSKKEKLAYEKEILNIYVSEHPLAPYEAAMSHLTKWTIDALITSEKDVPNGVFVGMISNVVTKMTKRNTRMATFTLEDTTGSMDCICFKFDENAEHIREDAIVKIKGKFEQSDRGNQIMAFEIEELSFSETDEMPSSLEISVSSALLNSLTALRLNNALKKYPGRDEVNLIVCQNDGRRFRAHLTQTINAYSGPLKMEILDLFDGKVSFV